MTRCQNPDCANQRIENFICCQDCVNHLLALYLSDKEARAAFRKNPEQTTALFHDTLQVINSRTQPGKDSGIN